MGPMEMPGAGIMALVTDPTGAVHGLWQARDFQGFGVAYEPNAPGWFDHASSDPDAAATYYSTLTGHTVIEPSPGMKVLNVGEQWFASFSRESGPRATGGAVELDLRRRHARGGARQDPRTRRHHRARRDAGARECDLAFVEPVMNTVVTIMGAGAAGVIAAVAHLQSPNERCTLTSE